MTHSNKDYAKYGFDSGVQFPPHNLSIETVSQNVNFLSKFEGHVFNFHEIAESYLTREYEGDRVFRTVFPSWDNTARVGERAVIVLNGTPENYEYWLSESIKKTLAHSRTTDRMVFINAWNEWAEGCHLEPDRVYGHGFLESTLRAQTGRSVLSGFPHKMVPLQFSDTHHGRTLISDLSYVLRFHLKHTPNNLRAYLNRNPRLKNLLMPLIVFGKRVFR